MVAIVVVGVVVVVVTELSEEHANIIISYCLLYTKFEMRSLFTKILIILLWFKIFSIINSVTFKNTDRNQLNEESETLTGCKHDLNACSNGINIFMSGYTGELSLY